MANIKEINECIIANNINLSADIKNEISSVRNELLTKIADISTTFTKEVNSVRDITTSLQGEIVNLKKHRTAGRSS